VRTTYTLHTVCYNISLFLQELLEKKHIENVDRQTHRLTTRVAIKLTNQLKHVQPWCEITQITTSHHRQL